MSTESLGPLDGRPLPDTARLLLDHLEAPVGLWDGCGHWVEATAGLYRALGTTPKALCGTPVTAWLETASQAIFLRQEARQHAGIHTAYVVTWRTGAGTSWPTLLTPQPVWSATGDRLGTVALLVDLTPQHATAAQLQALAYYDSLTGLPNRVLAQARLLDALRQVASSGQVVLVLWLDLDGFKAVNDTWGHQAGDAVLATVARRLQACARRGDTMARFGGDEFVGVFPGVEADAQGLRIARRLLRACRAPIAIPTTTVRLTASLGLAVAPRDGTTAEGLLHQTDLAMYRAKAAGGNTVMGHPSADTPRNR